jgi:hypothetical protein
MSIEALRRALGNSGISIQDCASFMGEHRQRLSERICKGKLTYEEEILALRAIVTLCEHRLEDAREELLLAVTHGAGPLIEEED